MPTASILVALALLVVFSMGVVRGFWRVVGLISLLGALLPPAAGRNPWNFIAAASVCLVLGYGWKRLRMRCGMAF